ncbi:MAG: asparagine synthase (glutamine-hydrolyzing), partial [Gammaproteobacteria bacterium]
MCGIAGVAVARDAAPPADSTLRRMCDTIVHRGPDDEGLGIAGCVGLGMRRLSIIDVTGGRQPLLNEDGSVRVVFNGEIYNFRELRQRLEKSGHRFNSNSDGEVIPHLWEEYGTEFAGHLVGMFAIALHDVRENKLVLVRDPIGIKPLYYSLSKRRLVFGSEIKTVLASGLVERRLNTDALQQFLSWEYVPAPGTLLEDVAKLAPGHMLELPLDGMEANPRRYWDVPPASEPGAVLSADEWAEAVDSAVGAAVRRELVSDVPLGAFLSGGVDSSLVVAHMGDARTFSIGFDDPTYNELEWSQRVARHLGVDHTVETIEPRVVDLFDHLMNFMDDPIGDFSIFPTYLVSRLARRGVTVALSGDGGDELFGGYETYVAQQKARDWARIPAPARRAAERLIGDLRPRAAKKGMVNKARRFVEGLQHDAALEHARWRLFIGAALRGELFAPGVLAATRVDPEWHILDLAAQAGDRDPLDRNLYVDMRSYLADNCLLKVDRMSMACSLETRVPFLEHPVAELAFRIPPELKVARGRTKVLLKKIAARYVPRDA